MSASASPIPPELFANALSPLPLSNVYAKAAELRNSIAHLERSNAELRAYSASTEGGDRECETAVRENSEVVERMKERISLCKEEVVGRGGRWHEEGGADSEQAADMEGAGDAPTGQDGAGSATANGHGAASRSTGGGRLTDEELARRLREQMGDEENDDDGVHL